ncbi:pre-mRNA splicing factor prp17 [Culex quinquefasciatus]|uniref:Pre-mRNA splicing factor prp17 n=1 Tax=Culex quinquefasciatus TaxID=7176 RepID=B0WH60_CULQU|nr:pre-mRNA splicing factor prp17 [Culex quinquefasciatus]|eukprot:XP_001848074.1 pre-mRNA splicing factor prp17 [Culex quinquefasciatus]
MAGPANPGLTEPKNMLQGSWRRHSDFQFENQWKTVHNYGTRLIRRWRKDRVEVVGHLQAAYDTDGKTVFESFIANLAGDKKKKLKIANLEEVDGFFGMPNGAEQVVIEEMMAKKQRRNRMTENKPNEYPRTVLLASGGNVRLGHPPWRFRPGVRTTFGRGKLDHLRRLKPGDAKSTSVSRPVRAAECLHRALILEFLLFLADTNSFAGASNGDPLLNLDHREDSINTPTLLHHNHRKDRALNALNQLGSIQRKINGSSSAFSKGGNSKLDVPKHWSRALVPPRGASVPQPP